MNGEEDTRRRMLAFFGERYNLGVKICSKNQVYLDLDVPNVFVIFINKKMIIIIRFN
jgi:hypothetical protein